MRSRNDPREVCVASPLLCPFICTVNPHSKDEQLPKVTPASLPFGPSLAAFAGRAARAARK
eukprot:1079057-Pyramimonas_sp.AAC.1